LAAVPSIGRASLVEAPARAPHATATAGLYERHSAKILSYCLHQLGSREEAEDAVQTTFMNAFRALGRGVVPEAESAWLFKIAENVCLSRRRSSWRRGRIESPSDFDVIEEIVPGPSRQRDELIGIEDALASMPEQQRRAILLREWQGLSYREIADELEVSQSAVETLIFRARRSLANGLEQPDLIKKPKRKSFRRALHMVDIGTIAAAVKTVLAGSAAVKATATIVAVTAAAGTAATVKVEGHSPQPTAPAPALVAPAPAAPLRVSAPAPASAIFVSAPARDGASKPAASRSAKPAKVPKPVAVAPLSVPAVAPSAPVESAPIEQPAAPAPEPAAPPLGEHPAASPAPAPAAEQPKQQEKSRGNGHRAGNGKAPGTEPTLVVEAPNPAPTLPVAPTTEPAPVAEGPAAKETKQERRGRKNRRELTAVTTAAPVEATDPAVDEAAPEAVEAPPAPPAEPASAEQAPDEGKRHRGRKK
jgi:RNA polymerase sigma factor (sigma-70 family)